MDQVEEKEAEWLVSQYIPKGCITILAGDGGGGKTTTWCGIAAAVSNGTKVFFRYQKNLQSVNHKKYCFLVQKIR